MAERARFIARYGNYSVGVQSAERERLGHDGQMVPSKRRVEAQFYNSLVSDEDYAVALQTFTFPGQPFDEETNQNVAPRYRIAVWDSEWAQQSEGWTDEEIEMMIAKLRSSVGVDMVELDISVASPFPNYDDLSVEEILQLLKLTGIAKDGVIAYEKANLNRADLLRRLEGVEASDDTVVVSA